MKNKNYAKRLLALILTGILMVSIPVEAAMLDEKIISMEMGQTTEINEAEELTKQEEGVEAVRTVIRTEQMESDEETEERATVEYHTQEEIREYIRNSGAGENDKLTFSETPGIKPPYSLGRISDTSLDSAIKMVNQIRYIAGLNADIQLSDENIQYAQAASLACYVNDELTHWIEKPSGMSDEMYDLARLGGVSNLFYSSDSNESLNCALLSLWMGDSDFSNKSRVGHRRWILYERLGMTGFGAVSGEKGTYGAMYVCSEPLSKKKDCCVMWPAQNMPVEYFKGGIWSVSTGENYLNAEEVTVKLRRRGDGKTWEFSNVASDGNFYVDGDCIIFEPVQRLASGDIWFMDYNEGDIFDVVIKGAPGGDINYTVNFFKLEKKVSSVSLNRTSATIKKGKSLLLKATVAPKDATEQILAWTSSDTEVATVNDNGKVTAKKSGVTVIRAETKDGSGKSASCKITVPCSITYWLNGGKNHTKNPSTYYNQKILLKNPVRRGYIFCGWYTDKNFKNKITTIKQGVEKDFILYAKWQNKLYPLSRTNFLTPWV